MTLQDSQFCMRQKENDIAGKHHSREYIVSEQKKDAQLAIVRWWIHNEFRQE